MEANLNIADTKQSNHEQPEINQGQRQSNEREQEQKNQEFYISSQMADPAMIQPELGQQQVAQQNPQPKQGLEKIGEFQGIFIKQRFLISENLTGCDQENQYQAFRLNEDGSDKVGKPIFKAWEKAGFWMRQCAFPNCRPLELKVNYAEYDKTKVNETPFLLIDRPATCTFLWCNRPGTSIKYFENSVGQEIGRIEIPWTCCHYHTHVYDTNGLLKYNIVAKCCQPGFFCPCPCAACKHIHLSIETSAHERVGTMEKYSNGCIKASLEDSCHFIIKFPSNASPREKTILMAAALFLDFRFFEERPVHEK